MTTVPLGQRDLYGTADLGNRPDSPGEKGEINMNLAAIRAWHDKLMEPGRTQCHGFLAALDKEGAVTGQCCLDVAVEVYIEASDTPVPLAVGSTDGDHQTYRRYRWSEQCALTGCTRPHERWETGVLPLPVAHWFGMGVNPTLSNPTPSAPQNPYVDGERVASRRESATALNDALGMPFPTIAAWVKATWPEAFADGTASV